MEKGQRKVCVLYRYRSHKVFTYYILICMRQVLVGVPKYIIYASTFRGTYIYKQIPRTVYTSCAVGEKSAREGVLSC
jgi:hypothetical protein